MDIAAKPLDVVLQARARTDDVCCLWHLATIQSMNGQVTLQQRCIGLHQGLQMRVLGFEGAVDKTLVDVGVQTVAQTP